MAATGMALSLQDLIASLDKSSLPKILQVCSGVYFQGSIYELSGCEVCLSTGDLMKVIDIELLSVTCQDVSNEDTFELPIGHKGLFKVVPEEMAYSSAEEMMSLRPLDLGSCLPFSFTSRSELTVGSFTVGANKAMTILCVERKEGKATGIRCRIQGKQGASAEVLIPLSCRGEFYECESEEWFTLQEIMSSPHLQKRRFRFNKSNHSDRHLILSPVYQVHAIMQLRKNVVKFPSTLAVEVVDASEQCKDMVFVTPMTLIEAHTQPDDSFPTMAEVIEEPEPQRLFLCKWLQQLHKGSQLILHRKGTSAMVLASSMKGRKSQQYFLISQQYNGRFRRRPREFSSVYELHVASAKTSGLRVNVTRHSDEVEEEGLPALIAGEQLDVLRYEKVELACGGKEGKKQMVDTVVCRRVQEIDDDDDDDEEGVEKEAENEEVFLPLYMQCHFVEKIIDNKKHRLKDLGKDFTLPLDVKVVSRDAALESDPLVSFPSLRLEEVTLEPTIQASLPQSPQHCFEIPTRWLSMFICLTHDRLPLPKDKLPADHVEMVTEVTDSFYYEFRRQTSSDETPPPRPPKRNTSSSLKSKEKASKPCKKSTSMTDNLKDLAKGKPKPPPKPHSKTDEDLPKPCPKDVKHSTKSNNLMKGVKRMTLNVTKRPPAPLPPDDDLPPPICPRKTMAEQTSGNAKPNTYVTADKKVILSDAHADVDSDHDYEELDGDLAEMIKRAQESSIFL